MLRLRTPLLEDNLPCSLEGEVVDSGESRGLFWPHQGRGEGVLCMIGGGVWVFGGKMGGVQGAKAPVRDVTALNTDSCIRVLAHTHFHLALSSTSSSQQWRKNRFLQRILAVNRAGASLVIAAV